MFSCGGKCGCGSGFGCKCGSGCSACAVHPELGFTEKTNTETIIVGVAAVKMRFEGSEMRFGAENGGRDFKCGAYCTCGK